MKAARVPLMVALSVLGLSSRVRRWWRGQRRMRRRVRESAGLAQVARAILAASGDLAPFMDVAESVAKTFGYDHGAVFLTQGGSLGWVVGYGRFAAYDPWEAPRSGLAVMRKIVAKNESFTAVGRRSRTPVADLPVPDALWQACLPLALGNQVLGVLVVARDTSQDDPEQALMTATSLAAQIALGVHNVTLYREREALAAAAERNRLAREIHDGIAQYLYMLTLNLETCVELAERGDPGLAARLLDSLRLSRNALWEARQYLFDLQPLFSEEGKLAQALESQIREFGRVGKVTVDFTVQGQEAGLPVETRAALYRVAQEALANVYKHAQAQRVRVALSFDGGYVRLDIADDGVGFPLDDGTAPEMSGRAGRGLRNMRQRVEEIGGSLQVRSAPGRGTHVSATTGRREEAS
ncbi:MAG: GAF domain-containing sensor histidine kinase [Chloroflexi bacterium]|nr:GAF domain-containing sensor histidine kinase [Chloroflexota bacterium]